MSKQQNQEAMPTFDIRQVYLKDASFESPSSPHIFAELTEHPQVDVQIKVRYQTLNEEKTLYEAVLLLQAHSKLKDKTVFLAEVQQAGIFALKHFPENEIAPMMEIVAANQIFPYARESISSLASRGGFPPVMINPINFEALYRQKRSSSQEQPNESATESADNVH